MNDDVADALETNRDTWVALQEHGVVPGSELGVDAFFFADTEASAESVAAGLRHLGWVVAVSTSRRGLLRRRTLWAVEASRSIGGVSLDVLDEMVTSLEALAEQHGAEFDGWGAQAPGA